VGLVSAFISSIHRGVMAEQMANRWPEETSTACRHIDSQYARRLVQEARGNRYSQMVRVYHHHHHTILLQSLLLARGNLYSLQTHGFTICTSTCSGDPRKPLQPNGSNIIIIVLVAAAGSHS
jgi:hypothetical protein